ncbi:hypothetical protein [Fodinibius salsisoli]|uniref:Uncharacterized protein n=1 Tax=Fodinibius salsisoli TaxID=2820877 RepID=A0ABT3PQI5_9BACT|nr:hypothetical protein [Fodinibius salsisoli]MCW9708090.1 hypothetical protein [Fodinibius salsisoli]
MTVTKEQLDNLRTEDGYFSEPEAKLLEKMEGKPLNEIVQDVEQQSNIPKGNPATDWSRKQKLAYLEDHSHQDYKTLIDERK